MTEPLSDRRAAATAGALVAAVVIVLGFGSGIGAVLSRGSDHASAAPAGRDLGGAVQSGPPPAVTASPSRSTSAALMSTGMSRPGVDASSTPNGRGMTYTSTSNDSMSPEPSAPTAAASGSASATSPASSPPAPCTGKSVVAAMADPFVMHFDKAHLETSPGQQAHDALNVDSYVKTHTVLFENMLAPAVDAALASLTGVQPFWMHFKTAHLETSPGDQVASAANVDQYTKTHTVLVENMAAPTMRDVTDYGCP